MTKPKTKTVIRSSDNEDLRFTRTVYQLTPSSAMLASEKVYLGRGCPDETHHECVLANGKVALVKRCVRDLNNKCLKCEQAKLDARFAQKEKQRIARKNGELPVDRPKQTTGNMARKTNQPTTVVDIAETAFGETIYPQMTELRSSNYRPVTTNARKQAAARRAREDMLLARQYGITLEELHS